MFADSFDKLKSGNASGDPPEFKGHENPQVRSENSMENSKRELKDTGRRGTTIEERMETDRSTFYHGFLCFPLSVESFARAIKGVLDDPLRSPFSPLAVRRYSIRVKIARNCERN